MGLRLSPELEAKCLRLAVRPAAEVEAHRPVEPATEEAFQAWVVKFAKEHGWERYHTRNSRKSEPGFPDLVMIREEAGRKARLVIAELKMPANKPSAAQKKWLRLFELAGAEVFTWWPWDQATIREVLT